MVAAGTLEGGDGCLYKERVGDQDEPVVRNGAYWRDCVEQRDLYLGAMYWAIMTLTSVGYGDILPTRPIEFTVCILVMFAMSIVRAYFLSCLCAMVTNEDPAATQYCQKLDELNSFINSNNIDGDTAVAARTFLHRHFEAERESPSYTHKRGLSGLSRSLQAHLSASFMDSRGLTKLRGLDFINECAPLVKKVLFSIIHCTVHTAGEAVPNDLATLYILKNGVIMLNGEVVSSATASSHVLWGSDFALSNIALIEWVHVHAITYTDVYELRMPALWRALATEQRRPEVIAFQQSMKAVMLHKGVIRALIRLAMAFTKVQTVAELKRRSIHAVEHCKRQNSALHSGEADQMRAALLKETEIWTHSTLAVWPVPWVRMPFLVIQNGTFVKVGKSGTWLGSIALVVHNAWNNGTMATLKMMDGSTKSYLYKHIQHIDRAKVDPAVIAVLESGAPSSSVPPPSQVGPLNPVVPPHATSQDTPCDTPAPSGTNDMDSVLSMFARIEQSMEHMRRAHQVDFVKLNAKIEGLSAKVTDAISSSSAETAPPAQFGSSW
jgi:hypothetical protein